MKTETIPFSKLLREGVWDIHSMADSSTLAQDMQEAKTTIDDMKKITAGLYYIYTTLEDAIQNLKNDYYVSKIYYPELFRMDYIKEDLKFYFGEDWQEKIYPTVAILTYISRIEYIAKTNPMLLIAHAYVRYMGDLSGGQMIKQMIREALNLTGDEGTKFYEFNKIPSIPEFKKHYRESLDSLDLSEPDQKAIIGEANLAFLYNVNFFREVNRPTPYPDEIEKPYLLRAYEKIKRIV